ncbi:hypothetical protein [Telluribacter humicola]|uniref:hypothetical protein n=1 Tax=Telluribacter humicola TaxID=1720261 RepID=UPI001A96BE94|nr:hypothetical protein [Telluribacter humicola]
MSALEEIKTHLDDQRNILQDINISFANMERLREEKYDSESRVKRFEFFQHHYYQLKFISVIQLSKLFGSSPKNDRRSFYVLLSLLETKDLDYPALSEGFQVKPDHIVGNYDDLRKVTARNRKWLKENVSVIKSIVDARNQVYAHSDPSTNIKRVLLEDIHTLVLLATKIYNDINFHIFDTNTHFLTEYWSIDYVLKIMAGHEQARMEEIERKRNLG